MVGVGYAATRGCSACSTDVDEGRFAGVRGVRPAGGLVTICSTCRGLTVIRDFAADASAPRYGPYGTRHSTALDRDADTPVAAD